MGAATKSTSTISTTPSPLTSALDFPRCPKRETKGVKSNRFATPSLLTSKPFWTSSMSSNSIGKVAQVMLPPTSMIWSVILSTSSAVLTTDSTVPVVPFNRLQSNNLSGPPASAIENFWHQQLRLMKPIGICHLKTEADCVLAIRL